MSRVTFRSYDFGQGILSHAAYVNLFGWKIGIGFWTGRWRPLMVRTGVGKFEVNFAPWLTFGMRSKEWLAHYEGMRGT